MKRIFITHLLPRQLVAKYGLSFAACNFSYDLISKGSFNCVYSLMPICVGGRIEDSAFLDSRFTLVYQQGLRRMGWLGRNFASLVEQWRVFREIPSKASVWFYNLTIHNIFLFMLIRFFKRQAQLNFIVLDLTPPFSLFSRNRLFLRLINGAHGRICLSHSELFRSENSIVLPGVVGMDVKDIPKLSQRNNRFLLCGVMNETISQTSLVLKTFAQLPQCELHITGMPDDEALVKDYAAKYPNIKYHGILSFDDYIQLLDIVTFVLSTRHPQSPENQCNFPSKILEALLHNRIVISTMYYPQLQDIRYFKVLSDEDSFREGIEEIVQMKDEQLSGYANQHQLIYDRFNAGVWEKAMEEVEQEPNRKQSSESVS